VRILCQHDPGTRSHVVGRKTGNESFKSDNLLESGRVRQSFVVDCWVSGWRI